MVKSQSEKGVKKIRSDNGGEFVLKQMVWYYEYNGIIHKTSYIHTFQQNKVVERKYSHLL